MSKNTKKNRQSKVSGNPAKRAGAKASIHSYVEIFETVENCAGEITTSPTLTMAIEKSKTNSLYNPEHKVVKIIGEPLPLFEHTALTLDAEITEDLLDEVEMLGLSSAVAYWHLSPEKVSDLFCDFFNFCEGVAKFDPDGLVSFMETTASPAAGMLLVKAYAIFSIEMMVNPDIKNYAHFVSAPANLANLLRFYAAGFHGVFFTN